jgi:hypothetical protein
MNTMRVLTIAAAAAVLSSGGAGVVAAAATSDVASTADPYGFADFYGVPHLGHETVSGSGCGGDGSVGDVIPDGYWRGFVRAFGPDSLHFDLVCVYGDDVDPELVSRWIAAHPGEPEPWAPDGFIVNNNPRVRVVPLGDTFFAHGTQFGADGVSCPFAQPQVPFDQGRDAWLRIVDGRAQWVVSSCAAVASPVPPTVPPEVTGPPSPAFEFPYENFWAVPQLGNEPVRGTGCGGDGSLGDTIPDGIWYGTITSLDATAMQFDVHCVYLGDLAAELEAEWYAENPDAGHAPVFPGGGFIVNNSTRTRTIPLGPDYAQVDAVWVNTSSDGDATYATCVPPADPAYHAFPDQYLYMPSWVLIENGQATWSLTECLHD